MIIYNNDDSFAVLTKVTGSVLPGTLPFGCLTFCIGLALALVRELTTWLDRDDYIEDTFSIRIVAVVIGILLAVRANMALNRWMEGISQIQLMLSKWGDAFITLSSFFSNRVNTREQAARILLFRARTAHWLSLMSCLTFATLRSRKLTCLDGVPIRELFEEETEQEQEEVAQQPPSPRVLASPPSGSALSGHSGGSKLTPMKSFSSERQKSNVAQGRSLLNDMDHYQSSHQAAAEKEKVSSLDLYVLSAPTADEVQLLDMCTDKVNCLMLWILQGTIQEIRANTLDTPPPIVTRFFQELSNGMLGFNQAHKVAMVPFPFPFAQMVSLLLVMLCLSLPLYIDIFTKNPVITPALSFLLPICYLGLNSVAIELEEPFGTDWNDVDIEVRHEDFLWVLVDVLRQATMPPVSDENIVESEILSGMSRRVGDNKQTLAHGVVDYVRRMKGNPARHETEPPIE